MKICIATILAMIALEFTIARDLPRMSYITFLDAVFLTSFIFTFLAIVEIITVHYLIVGEMESLAVRIHRSSRWIFPLAYFVVLIVLGPSFFVWYATAAVKGP